MRVLHLTTFLQGGAGRAITSLAVAQAREGHEVSLLTSFTGAPGYGNYPGYLDELAAAGVEAHAIDSLFDRSLERQRPVASALDSMLCSRNAPDFLHAHAGTPAALALAAARRACRAVPVIQTMHGWGIAKTAAQSAADVATLNAMDRVVVPARSSAALLSSFGVRSSQMSVVPYGVQPQAADDAEDSLMAQMRAWRDQGCLVACCVGTIGERKNQALLVEALARVAADISVQAVFVGDGAVHTLRDLACARGVSARVHLAGYRRDARRLQAAASVSVLPSRSEGQPLAVLEAFCDGVPVVASRIPELAELIDAGLTGRLVEPEDPQDLADALAWVARHPGQAITMAAHAHARYQEHFTVERMVDGYRAEYERTSWQPTR